ncbi:MAG TPA: MlaE family lipid ABC transporter permease subunit [Xanthobacteraceae bacterium]|nr:MlaE family lipid ABC transporter permease subunit [Xanthobacteraceae bacterium]
MVSEALLTTLTRGDRLELAAAGTWTADRAADLEGLVDAAVREFQTVPRILVDMARVERLDTFGAWLLERLVRDFTADGREIDVVGLPPRYNDLVHEARHSNRKQAEPEAPALVDSFAKLLRRAGHLFLRDILLNVQMFGQLVAALGRILRNPRRFRFTSMVHHLDRVGWRAVPIILLITFLIGCIVAQQGIFHFRQFGADVYVVDMVGILTLRELGVLIVAIMIAGRSGSSYTAELGSMKMREEVDALQTMGLDPIEVLILPRILALVIALPCLTFLGSMAALYGGGLVAWLYGGMSPEIFLSRLQEAISLDHFEVGLSKAPFMALVIGMIASIEGLSVKGSAESLGLQTTSSVVKSIFVVIVLDGIFAMFFAAIGK